MNEEEKKKVLRLLIDEKDLNVTVDEEWKVNLKKNFDKRICDIEDVENDETYREFYRWCYGKVGANMTCSVLRLPKEIYGTDEGDQLFEEVLFDIIENNIDEFFDMCSNTHLLEIYEEAEFFLEKMGY